MATPLYFNWKDALSRLCSRFEDLRLRPEVAQFFSNQVIAEPYFSQNNQLRSTALHRNVQ